MGYQQRKVLFSSIEKIRKRPLITYVTSIRGGMGGNMAGDAIRPFIDQLELIPNDKKEVDFLIISNGGDPITALRMMSILRERFDNVAVLLPYVAYSAATILSLGADKIVMHKYSNLGPVDPQITVSHKGNDGKVDNLQFGTEDINNFMDFLKRDVGLSNQGHRANLAKELINQIGPVFIGNAKRSQRLSLTLSQKLLLSHLSCKNKAKKIAQKLNSSYYHHGYAVGRKEAIEIGLPIETPGTELEDLLWKVWLDYEAEMKCNDNFDVIKEIMNDPNSQAINSVPVINIPANLPEPQKQAIYNKVANSVTVTSQKALTLSLLVASIESKNVQKSFYVDMNVRYWRDAAMNINFNCNQTLQGWK